MEALRKGVHILASLLSLGSCYFFSELPEKLGGDKSRSRSLNTTDVFLLITLQWNLMISGVLLVMRIAKMV